MTKQDKIKKWLDDNYPKANHGLPGRRIIYKTDSGEYLFVVKEPTNRAYTLIGIADAEAKTFLACPDFQDDIEAPVALPRQERGKRFEPEKFVPDDSRNVLMRFQSLVFTGYFLGGTGWYAFAYDGLVLELNRTTRANEPFTWEEL